MDKACVLEKRFDGTCQTARAKRFFEDKISFVMSPSELFKRLKDQNIQIVDVRSRDDYNENHIKGAVSIPINELRDSLNTLSNEKVTVVYCYYQQCHASANAAIILADQGYPVMELEGGFKTWRQLAYPIEM